MKQYNITIWIHIFCCFSYMYSQQPTPNQLPKGADPFSVYEHMPKDPQIANLSGVVGNELNQYNGKANIEVPIYNIQFEGKNIPIQLYYDTGGVRAYEESGWVGLNWKISGQFSVTREVYGFDDFSTLAAGDYQNAPSNGYIYNPINLSLEEGAARPFLSFDNILNVHHSFGLTSSSGGSRFMDTQPDVFHMTAFGNTYNFILKKKGSSNIINTEVFNNNNVQITYDLSLEQFTLVNEDGYIYTFGTKSYNTPFYTVAQSSAPTSYESAFQALFNQTHRENETIITSWSLDNVKSPIGNELNFTYQKGLHFSFPKYSFDYDGYDHAIKTSWPSEQYIDGNRKVNYSISTSIIENNYLSNISGDFGQVLFQLEERNDLCTGSAINDLSVGGYFTNMYLYTKNVQIRSCHGDPTCTNSTTLTAKKLGGIEVRNINDKTILSADLEQGYFNSNSSGIAQRYYRLKLNGISISDKHYEFSYINENNLPAKDTDGVDFWGFYNGKEVENDGLVPKIGRFITSRINGPNGENYLGQSFVNYSGANRGSNFNFGQAGLLKQIILPTKGSVNYEYEPNDVVLGATSPFTTTETFANSTRLKYTNMVDESNYGFTYQYLKYANDPSYNYFEKDPITLSSNSTPVSITLNEVFTSTNPTLLEVNGYIETYTGWEGISYWANYPILVAEDINTGQEYTLFTYADAPSYINAPSNNVNKTISLPAGEFRVVKRWADIPPGANYEDYPPIPAVNFYDTGSFYYEIDPNNPGDLSGIFEKFEVGGARISKIITKDNNGGFLNGTKYEYNYPGGIVGLASSGKLMDDLIFFKKTSGFQSYTPRGYANTFLLTQKNQVGGNNSAAGSHIGYSFVRSKEIDAFGNSKGWVDTEFSNQENEYFTTSFSLPYQWDMYIGNGDPYINVLGFDLKWTCSGIAFGNDCAGDSKFVSTLGDVSIQNSILLGLPLKSNFSFINGEIIDQKIYNEFGDLKKQSVFEYTNLKGSLSNNYFASFMYIPLSYQIDSNGVVASSVDNTSLGPWGASHDTYYPYLFPLHYGLVAKKSKTVQYIYSDADYITTEITSNFNQDTFFPESITSFPSNGLEKRKEFLYVSDPDVIVNSGTANLINENRINTLIESKTYLNNIILNNSLYEYQNSSNTGYKTMLATTSFSKGTNSLENVVVYHRYDDSGNVLEVSLSEGHHIIYIWGYSDQLLIAKIENATYSEVSSILGPLSDVNETNLAAINNLRSNALLSQAMVTTYEYEPLVGITKITDPKGLETTYHYDALNRLEFIKDGEGNILEENKYNYKSN